MSITQRYEDRLTQKMVGQWLDNWHSVIGSADRYDGWVDVVVDVERSVLNLRPVLQDIFDLYCQQGLNVLEIAQERGCKIKSVLNRYYELRRDIHFSMCGSGLYIPPQRKCTYRTDSWECDGFQPVGEKCL